MTFIADPAVTTPGSTTPPHRPLWIAGLTVASLGAVGYIVLATTASTGVDHSHEVMSLIRGGSSVALAVGAIITCAVWMVRRRAEDTARRSATRQVAHEECEEWHATQYQALSEQHERIEENFRDIVKGIGTDVAGQLRAELADEIARAVRSAHAAGYIAGVTGRQAAAVNGVSGGGRLRLIDPENHP